MRSGEGWQSKIRGRRWWPRTKLGTAALVGIIACAVLTTVVLYVDGEGAQRAPIRGTPTRGDTTATFNVANIENSYSELVGDLIVKPGPVQQGRGRETIPIRFLNVVMCC